jgi:hypothetical protein
MADFRDMETLAKRFWAKVQTTGKPGDCWTWTGSKDRYGYGQIQVKQPDGRWRPVKAHRVAWFLMFGRWPDPCGLHGCDTPGCVRIGPGHVFEGTNADNAADRDAKGRGVWERPAEFCERGHQMIGRNVRTSFCRTRNTNSRRCRICENEAQRRRRNNAREKPKREAAAFGA